MKKSAFCGFWVRVEGHSEPKTICEITKQNISMIMVIVYAKN